MSILSIRVNNKPLPIMRRAYLAYIFARIAMRQLIGTRYQLNIFDCTPMDDATATDALTTQEIRK